jgi:adenosylmethionine-8-amino-7-oxononanoate aminotransferase
VILDEVATGFGRSGALFAAEREQVEPDLLCLAKALSGGYLPLAATLATDRVYEAFLGEHEEFRTFFHGHTFTGNALACAAARASLGLCRRPEFLPRAREVAARLAEGLAPLQDHEHVLEVRQYGTMAGIELVARRPGGGRPAEPWPTVRRTGHRATLAARERGVILRPLGDVAVLMPPHAMTDEQLDTLCAVARQAVDAACG